MTVTSSAEYLLAMFTYLPSLSLRTAGRISKTLDSDKVAISKKSHHADHRSLE